MEDAMRLVTTNDTVIRDLKASLVQREGVPMGLTWGDVKAAFQLLGVRDDDRIAGIELGMAQLGSGRLYRDDEADGIVVREG
jgi:hypothetical protein